MPHHFSRYIVHNLNSVEESIKYINECSHLSAPSTILAPSLELYWIIAFLRHYGPFRNLAVTIIDDEDRHKLLAPFQLVDSETINFLCDETSDYNDFLFDKFDKEVLHAAFSFWFSNGIRRIVLSRLPSDSLTVPIVSQLASELGLEVLIELCDPMAVVKPSPKLPAQKWPGVKSAIIKEYQRKLRVLQKESVAEFRIVSSIEELELVLPIMAKFHVDRWLERGIQSKYSGITRQQFTEELAKAALQRRSLVLSLMFIDQKLAAYRMGFLGGGTLFDWYTSFSLEWRQRSPGSLLLLEILSKWETLGFTKFSFLRGDETYKSQWSDKIEHTLTLSITR